MAGLAAQQAIGLLGVNMLSNCVPYVVLLMLYFLSGVQKPEEQGQFIIFSTPKQNYSQL
jgi:hypothetical protein